MQFNLQNKLRFPKSTLVLFFIFNLLTINAFALNSIDVEFQKDLDSLMKEFGDSDIKESLTKEELRKAEELLMEEESYKGKKPPYVKFEDIKHWESMGERYAAGYDEEGRLLAIYDLRFPNRKNWSFVRRSILGSIGVGDFNLGNLFKQLRRAIEERKAERRQAESVLMQDEKSRRRLEKIIRKEKKALRFINKAEKRYGDKTDELPKKWWKKVEWNKVDYSNDKNAPEYFSLAEINLTSKMSRRKRKKFNKGMEKMGHLMSKYLKVEMDKNFFHQFRFKKIGKGYEVHFVGSPTQVESKTGDQPTKVADLVRYESSFWRALAQLIIEQGLSEIAGLIPYVGPIFEFAIDRWFDLFNEQTENHREALLEYLNAAERGSAPSPMSVLSPENRMKAAVYVTSHNASIIRRVIMKKREKYWRKSLVEELEDVVESEAYLDEKGWSITNRISPLYGIAEKTNDDGEVKRRLYLLAESWIWGKKPLMAISYDYPHYIRAKRNAVEIVSAILDFIDLPWFGVMKAVKLVYKFLVEKDIDDAKEWESRLVNRLLLDNENGQWNWEIDILYAQRLNPFELDREEEENFVLKSRALIGL